MQKLHITNKVRHETEIKLGEQHEKCKDMTNVITMKDEMLSKRQVELDEHDRRINELERSMEALEIKKQGVERTLELTKKQLNEKIVNLNEIIAGEKETREMWVERYEKEHKEQTIASAQLLQARSDTRD